jgi:hypothetical protein
MHNRFYTPYAKRPPTWTGSGVASPGFFACTYCDRTYRTLAALARHERACREREARSVELVDEPIPIDGVDDWPCL